MQLVALVKRFHIPAVYVETNGLGAFIKPILVRALRQEDVACGVVEIQVTGNKNARILGAIEPPLSSGVLWAHTRVVDGPAWDEMKDWNPALSDQADGYLDSAAGALIQAPVRITRALSEISERRPGEDWRPRTGTPEVIVER